MKELIEKIKSYLKGSSKKEISYEREGINPTHDWNVILILVFALLFVLAIASVYLYMQIQSGALFPASTDAKNTSVTINQDLLDKTIQKINADKTAFDSAKTKGSVSDPSI